MPLDFPANPANGQVYDSYVYNSTVGAWQAREDSATVAITSPTAPTTANNGDIWYNSNTGVSYVYYADGSSAQWVEIVSSAVPLLNTKADLAGDIFTGNVTAPRFISNIATGTSPLSVTSTTVNTNLNADLLDGNHASAFSLTSHTHDDIVSKGVLSAETGRSVHDSGIYTFNTNNSSLGNSTPTEYWSTLAWGRGAAGSAELAATWTTNGNELWYRSLRDVTDNWWAWKKIYHSGNTVPVANGGTGATTLTSGGYLKGAGTAAITSQTGIPAGDITSGSLAVARGGTGVTTGAGLFPITPTSITGTGGSASIGANGVVTLSGSGIWYLNGIFSSSYTNYRIIMRGSADADRGFGWRFSQGGVQNQNAFYHQSLIWSGGSGVATSVVQNQTYIGYSLGHKYMAMTADILAPNVTGYTKHMIAEYSGLNSATTGAERHIVSGILRDVNYQADGIMGFISAGSFNGTIQVFGYNG